LKKSVPPGNAQTRQDRSIEGKTPNPHASFRLLLEKLPISEEQALTGISKFRKRAVLRKFRDACRWNKATRIVIDGKVWFYPTGSMQRDRP